LNTLTQLVDLFVKNPQPFWWALSGFWTMIGGTAVFCYWVRGEIEKSKAEGLQGQIAVLNQRVLLAQEQAKHVEGKLADLEESIEMGDTNKARKEVQDLSIANSGLRVILAKPLSEDTGLDEQQTRALLTHSWNEVRKRLP
jgi:hypothetical protein